MTLWVVLQDGRGRGVLYYTDAPGLRLQRRPVPARQLRPLAHWPGGAPTGCRWLRVEPNQHHVRLPPPNSGNPAYSNAVLFGPKHGRWLGYDELEYREGPLPGAPDACRAVVRQADPSDERLRRHRGAGTLRYSVQVQLSEGGTLRAPGAEANGRGGLGASVQRVSFRRDDSYLGYLSTYFNVPNVFASAGRGADHQTDRYQGADCADVMLGAARRAGAAVDYTAVSGLTRYARPVTPVLLMDEKGIRYADGERAGAAAELDFGSAAQPGDLVLIDYQGFDGTGRRWDHVGVLGADRGLPGRLDPEDGLLHMASYWGLTEMPLHREGPALIQLLRWNSTVQRAWARQRRRTAR